MYFGRRQPIFRPLLAAATLIPRLLAIHPPIAQQHQGVASTG
jgi:hypothetical protein